ncbi:MAG: aminotransferase class I/II-fold pyridoxal phosphate-dependent enzyme [Acidobacteriota bacterium]|nr:aminotransferase class I/II-fold pyridoxal phosphate-dependent enzyme [Acidobacteriota bacterium]
MTSRFHAPYVQWAATRTSARFDLAGSAVLASSAEALHAAADDMELTGEHPAGFTPLVSAISARYGVPADSVTTAHGTTGANFLVCAALLEAGDEVLVERPGYDALHGGPQLVGAVTKPVARRFDAGFQLDPAGVRRAITSRTRLIVITNPHNPSGVVARPEAIDEIGEIARHHGAHVLVDEVYMDVAAPHAPSTPGVAPTAATRGDVFISTSSLSKSYGLAPLRCGWILSSPAVAERLRRTRAIVEGGASLVAERVAARAFHQIDALLARSRGWLDANRAVLAECLQSRPELEWCDPGGGSIVFPRIRTVPDSSRFVERLLTLRETAVVPGHLFGAPAHFRIGVGGDTQALRQGLASIGSALTARDW